MTPRSGHVRMTGPGEAPGPAGAPEDPVARVRAALVAAGSPAEVVLLSDSARTAALAAAALGCPVAAIANSLVFELQREPGGPREPLLVLASGAHRVDTEAVARGLGAARLRRASPDTVLAASGFAVGGVAPVGHPAPLPTLVDTALAAHETVWAAAGSPHAVFATSYDELLRLTGGTPVDVAPADDPPERDASASPPGA